jgi:hypothetical protein
MLPTIWQTPSHVLGLSSLPVPWDSHRTTGRSNHGTGSKNYDLPEGPRSWYGNTLGWHGVGKTCNVDLGFFDTISLFSATCFRRPLENWVEIPYPLERKPLDYSWCSVSLHNYLSLSIPDVEAQ